MRRAAALASLVLLAGCATTPAPVAAPLPPAETASDFYALEAGSVWSYRVVAAGGQALFMTTKVEKKAGALATLSSGKKRFQLRVEPGAIVKAQAGYAVLADPIEAGHSWDIALEGEPGKASIVAVDQVVATPAGSFEQCVVVRESFPQSGMILETTYAPAVGPVVLVVAEGKEVLQRGELQSFVRGGEAQPEA